MILPLKAVLMRRTIRLVFIAGLEDKLLTVVRHMLAAFGQNPLLPDPGGVNEYNLSLVVFYCVLTLHKDVLSGRVDKRLIQQLCYTYYRDPADKTTGRNVAVNNLTYGMMADIEQWMKANGIRSVPRGASTRGYAKGWKRQIAVVAVLYAAAKLK